MPRFSIVITTTDRPSLLAPAVRAALEIRFSDFELVVSDNFSKQPAADLLADVRDKRLRIIRTGRRLPVGDHWEFVWEHLTGDFVMYLGDDNALHPDILARVDAAIAKYSFDVVMWRGVTYYHPDWDIAYGSLPRHGHILGVEPGSTGGLYIVRQDNILQEYCRDLRLSFLFPCMQNFVFRKSLGDMIHSRMGRIFWPPNADICCGYLVLGAAAPGAIGFFDGYGAICGRSRDSNMATVYSRGKASRKYHDFVEEHKGQDALPHHEPKFMGMSNTLAATISQARARMPDVFEPYKFDVNVLAVKTVEDMYVDRTIPWVDDPRFQQEVEQFFLSLPADISAKVREYRDICAAKLSQTEAEIAAAHASAPSGPPPLLWVADGGKTVYVNLTALGVEQGVGNVAARLPEILAVIEKMTTGASVDAFVRQCRAHGFLGARVDADLGALRPQAAAPG